MEWWKIPQNKKCPIRISHYTCTGPRDQRRWPFWASTSSPLCGSDSKRRIWDHPFGIAGSRRTWSRRTSSRRRRRGRFVLTWTITSDTHLVDFMNTMHDWKGMMDRLRSSKSGMVQWKKSEQFDTTYRSDRWVKIFLESNQTFLFYREGTMIARKMNGFSDFGRQFDADVLCLQEAQADVLGKIMKQDRMQEYEIAHKSLHEQGFWGSWLARDQTKVWKDGLVRKLFSENIIESHLWNAVLSDQKYILNANLILIKRSLRDRFCLNGSTVRIFTSSDWNSGCLRS